MDGCIQFTPFQLSGCEMGKIGHFTLGGGNRTIPVQLPLWQPVPQKRSPEPQNPGAEQQGLLALPQVELRFPEPQVSSVETNPV